MAELADAADSKSADLRVMGVRFPLPAPRLLVFPKIHKVVRNIPKGKVSTYGAVARAAGYPGASRQVVWALRAGRGLPWHRVVGAKGKILLPEEAGMEQRFRLENEGVAFVNGRVRLEECEFNFARKKKRPAKGRSGSK